MLSMPPDTTIPAEPALMTSCASMVAFMPEPQTLLTVVAPVASGSPAPRAACRAGAWPWPAGSTQPIRASSTRPGGPPGRDPGARERAPDHMRAEVRRRKPRQFPEEAAERRAHGGDDDNRI